MEFKQKATQVIYNGVPVGKCQKHIIEDFYLAIDSILAQKKYFFSETKNSPKEPSHSKGRLFLQVP